MPANASDALRHFCRIVLLNDYTVSLAVWWELLSFGVAPSSHRTCPLHALWDWSLGKGDQEHDDQKHSRASGRGHRDQGKLLNEVPPQHSLSVTPVLVKKVITGPRVRAAPVACCRPGPCCRPTDVSAGGSDDAFVRRL
jgi:hypothetical protein